MYRLHRQTNMYRTYTRHTHVIYYTRKWHTLTHTYTHTHIGQLHRDTHTHIQPANHPSIHPFIHPPIIPTTYPPFLFFNHPSIFYCLLSIHLTKINSKCICVHLSNLSSYIIFLWLGVVWCRGCQPLWYI